MTDMKIRLTLFITSLVLSSLACSIFVGGPAYPEQGIPYSNDEALGFREQLEQALLTGAETGIVSLQITESQLTAHIANRMAQQSNPPFTDPQIYLRNDQMQMYGKITRGWFTANMLVVMNVTVDEATAQPKIEIASADFGPIPAPEGINSALTALISEAFTGTLGPVAVGFRLESISIADGIMTMTGRIR
jgi:hypothetical protein